MAELTRRSEWLGRRLRSSTHRAEYRLLSEIACGGMATVWRACLADYPEVEVAIKTIRPELANDPRIVELFAHEALVAARLRHRGIVQHLDFGVDDGVWFITTEYLAGATLRDVIASQREHDRTTPLWFAVGALLRVCAALDYMHDLVDDGGKGLLHNDLSPENVMVTFTGAVKLLDLGSVSPSGNAGATRPHVGKYSYLPPELLLGRELDRRSDIHALGVMLYELVVGEKPFRGDQSTMVASIAHGPPPDPRKMNPEVSVEVARVIRKAMAREPDERYPDVVSLARELRKLVHSYLLADDDELGAYILDQFSELLPSPATTRGRQLEAHAQG